MSKTPKKIASNAPHKKAVKDLEVKTAKSGAVRGGIPAVQKSGRLGGPT